MAKAPRASPVETTRRKTPNGHFFKGSFFTPGRYGQSAERFDGSNHQQGTANGRLRRELEHAVAGVEAVAQPIAQDVDSHHHQQDGQAWE